MMKIKMEIDLISHRDLVAVTGFLKRHKLKYRISSLKG